MASIDRTAYPRFKRAVSAQELTGAFTPTQDEITWARGKTQSDQHLLALLVRLKCYQRLGYFAKLVDVPPAVVDHMRGVLELPGTAVAQTDADRTAKRHRQFVRERLGVKYEAGRVREIAEQAVRTAVQTKDNPADLINVALEELVRQRCELPGYTTLDAMVASIRTEVNGVFFTLVAARPDRVERARLERMLVVDLATRRSEFDRIKTPAQAPTLGKFKRRLAHLQALDAIGPTEQWLEGVPPGKIVHFAGEARVANVDDMRKTSDAKRVTLLVSLLHQQRVEARDEVVTMFCKRMAALHKKGRERLEELHEVHRAESERLLGVFGEVLSGTREATTPPGPSGVAATATGGPSADTEVAERAGRLLLKTLESAGGLEQLSATHEAISAYHGNNYLPLLEGFYRSHRPALFTLVDALEMSSTTADRSVLDAVEFIRANRDRRSDWIPETTLHTRDGRLGNHSHKNRLYWAFRELGRVIRTVTLLRFLSEPGLREQITAITNKAEAFHGFAEWLMIGGRLIGHNDPDHQERVVKFNELLANCAIYSTALDITDVANQLAAEGYQVERDDLATITPYIQHTIRRMGDLVLDLAPPDETPVTRLDLEPRVLFAPSA